MILRNGEWEPSKHLCIFLCVLFLCHCYSVSSSYHGAIIIPDFWAWRICGLSPFRQSPKRVMLRKGNMSLCCVVAFKALAKPFVVLVLMGSYGQPHTQKQMVLFGLKCSGDQNRSKPMLALLGKLFFTNGAMKLWRKTEAMKMSPNWWEKSVCRDGDQYRFEPVICWICRRYNTTYRLS